MDRMEVLFGFILALFFSISIGSFSCSATSLPTMNINLNGVTLEEINAGSKDTKYTGNTIDLTVDGVLTPFNNVEIKGRGNSSWLQPKKPYQIKFHKKEDLFDFGKSKKYILLANYLDSSYLRNTLAFYLGGVLNTGFVPKNKFLNFYADNVYVGLYSLSTKNEIGSKRINLKNDLGGVMELDNFYSPDGLFFTSNQGDVLNLKDNVNEDDESMTQKTISDFSSAYNKLEKAVATQDWASVTSLIDIDSFVSYYLVSEISANLDAYLTSCYFYKDGPIDKIHAGPIWDFDIAFGNPAVGSLEINRLSTKRLWSQAREVDWTGRKHSNIYARLTSIPQFRELVRSKWIEKFHNKNSDILSFIDKTASTIRGDAMQDSEKWGRQHFDTSIIELKQWVDERLNYLDYIYTHNINFKNGIYIINGLPGKYYIDQLLDGSYRIINLSDGKVLDVKNADPVLHNTARFYEWNGTTAQRWYITKDGDNQYHIVSKLTGLVLDFNGTTLQMNELSGSTTQQFTLTPVENPFSIDENAHYEFVSALDSNFVIDIAGGSTEISANTQLYTSNDSLAQSFYFRKNSDETYTIYNTKSKKALDVVGGSWGDCANIQQYSVNNTNAQKWLIYQHSDGSLTLINYGSLKAIDLPGASIHNEANIQQYTINNTGAQKWKLRLVETEERARLLAQSQGVVADGLYIVHPAKNTNFAIDVAGGSLAAGANVQLYTNNGTSAQQWRVTHDASGYIKLQNPASQKFLDVQWGESPPGTNVFQYTANNTAAQKWIATLNGDGSILLTSSINTHRVLDISNGQFKNETNIKIWSPNGSSAQAWTFERIGD